MGRPWPENKEYNLKRYSKVCPSFVRGLKNNQLRGIKENTKTSTTA